MKTTYLIIFVALFCIAADEAPLSSAPVADQQASQTSVSETGSTETIQAKASESSASVNIIPELKEAKKLEGRKEYLKASEIYQSLLQNPDLTKNQKKKVLRAFEDFNMRWMLSKEKTKDSVIYEVVAGDNLTKISKKYKTNIDLIRKCNGLKKDVIFPGMKLKIVTGVFKISVDKSDNELTLYQDDKPIKHYTVSTGTDNGTPVGEFKIINKIENPTWYKEKKVIPASSAENELGSRWLGFDKPGYGIHGTIDPKSIGSQASSGCVRMHNKDVEELYIIVPHGTSVTITD